MNIERPDDERAMRAYEELAEEFDIDDDEKRLERRLMGALGAGILVAFAGVALTIWVFFLWNRADGLSDEVDEQREGVEAVSAGLDAVREQVEDLGEEPIVPPAEEIVEDVETGGSPVLVPGPEGQRGEPGPGPTTEEIQAAVDLHCSRQPGGSCEGAVGPAGPEGASGAAGAPGVGVIGASLVDCHLIFVFSDGSSDDAGFVCGPPGDPATDEQVQAAVDNFCAAHNNCAGPQGPEGPAGPAGPQCQEGYFPIDVEIPSSPGFVFSVCAKPEA